MRRLDAHAPAEVRPVEDDEHMPLRSLEEDLETVLDEMLAVAPVEGNTDEEAELEVAIADEEVELVAIADDEVARPCVSAM